MTVDDYNITLERNPETNRMEICVYDQDEFFIKAIDVTDLAIKETLDCIFINEGVTGNGSITLERHIPMNHTLKSKKRRVRDQ